jgi:hypothetical protein
MKKQEISHYLKVIARQISYMKDEEIEINEIQVLKDEK